MDVALRPEIEETYALLRPMLSAERAAIREEMAAISQEAHRIEWDIGGLHVLHFDHAHALTASLQTRLTEIDEALARMDAGTYGVCATCGNQIPVRRLDVMPFTMFCVPCQRREEARLGGRR